MKKSAILTCAVLLLVCALAPAASAAPKRSIIGSWLSGDTADQPGVLWTFNRGGTLTSSANTTAFSGGHGVWERVAPRTFDAVNVGFIFGADGLAELIIENQVTFEVSRDGETFTAAFESTVKTLDGATVQVVTGTAEGRRLSLD